MWVWMVEPCHPPTMGRVGIQGGNNVGIMRCLGLAVGMRARGCVGLRCRSL